MTVAMEHGSVGELIELLDRQRGLYTELRELSRRQSDIVASREPDVSGLVLLLGQRQNLIDQLTAIGGRMEPFRRNWPSLWQSLDPDARRRMGLLIDHVQAMLDAIVEQDERDRASLISRSSRRDRVAAERAALTATVSPSRRAEP